MINKAIATLTQLNNYAKKKCKAIMDIAFKEIKTIRDIACKEIKSLIIISVFTFSLIFFSLSDASWKPQTIIIEFLNKTFSFEILYSILLTGVVTIIYKILCYKICKDNKNKEKYYWISTTFLDRVAAICLGGLGIGIASFANILLFYCWLDNGEFKNNISIMKLTLSFSIFVLPFFITNIILKYLSKKVEAVKAGGKNNGCMLFTFLILYTILMIISNCLVKLL